MKEIQAISKLSHKNIVGYKGCWVEAEIPDKARLSKIMKKIHKRTRFNQDEEIEEDDLDDPEFVMRCELEDGQQKMFNERCI